MIVVADASVLVGELLRKRGRELLMRPELQVLVAEDQWSETQHELSRRLGIMESSGRLSPDNRRALEEAVHCRTNMKAPVRYSALATLQRVVAVAACLVSNRAPNAWISPKMAAGDHHPETILYVVDGKTRTERSLSHRWYTWPALMTQPCRPFRV